uniref:Uncharacterized protein n=1 Tax=Peronospora matthiolae TaxID=2874970 RepID=A0AAV1U1X7_9STRA
MSSDICGVSVQALYLEDPGNKEEPVGFSLCEDLGSTCKKNGCSCRRASEGTVKNETKYFGTCVVLQSGADCVTSGDDYVTCAVESSIDSAAASPATAEAQDESRGAQSRTPSSEAMTTKEIAESNGDLSPVATTGTSGSSAAPDAAGAAEASTASSSNDSMNSTVLVLIIVVAVIFVALVSYIIRSYCVRRAKAERKLATRRNRSMRSLNFDATSPSNATGRSSATPSFPAYDKCSRANPSPTAYERAQEVKSGRGREPMPDRGHELISGRGRKTPDTAFVLNGAPPMNREPKSGRGLQYLDMEESFASKPARAGNREPGSAPGRKIPGYEPDHRGHREPRGQHEPSSGRGRRENAGVYGAQQPVKAPPKNAAPSGGTVLAGRNTYERVVQFAQLAAFEAPPAPPLRPHKPIQSVPVTNAVPKRARTTASNARPAAPSPPGFYIDEAPMTTDYDILSPKSARSLAPSVASSATTIVAPGRNRPTPLQHGRRPQYAAAPAPCHYLRDEALYGDESSYNESTYDESRYDESGFNSKFKSLRNYDESFVSEVSSMAWSGASGLSDESFYRAAPSNMARIPLIEAPRDDDDAHSEDAYSDWGNSTLRSTDDSRSTSASDASFFSVNSDFTDSISVSKELEF